MSQAFQWFLLLIVGLLRGCGSLRRGVSPASAAHLEARRRDGRQVAAEALAAAQDVLVRAAPDHLRQAEEERCLFSPAARRHAATIGENVQWLVHRLTPELAIMTRSPRWLCLVATPRVSMSAPALPAK
ncbi:hypothetical protein [Geminicoccus harenae]|uniref:hypothetical protein n=1 Tax=Geminicoccus harenae TaxID=2498453 RepID=UPI00168AEA4A|nr:hypothetical protein [Geminicoccus harenae]